jgi:hypothetical protein
MKRSVLLLLAWLIPAAAHAAPPFEDTLAQRLQACTGATVRKAAPPPAVTSHGWRASRRAICITNC